MKISIITVCRNDLTGLKDTFASLQTQDYNNIEWCVVDGASSDGTAAWLRDNHQLNGIWLSESDEGVYDAMNKGIRQASGQYVLFLNSGDRMAQPNVISKLVDHIKREQPLPDFVYGDCLDVDENGKEYYRKALPVSYIKAGMITRHQAMLYRREIISDNNYPTRFKLSGDYALTAYLLKRNDLSALKVDFPICLFSLGGKHDTYRFKALLEDFEIRRNILKENLPASLFLFCIHFLHHCLRGLFPSLNKKLIYKQSP